MSSNDKKPWERPWTTQEMIDNASNWNLAGDSGLLKYLEEFSENMFSKVKDTNKRINDLIDSAEETSLALNNATNQFMGLRNTQFIESRVYEDDETLPTKPQETEKEGKPKPTEAERLKEMKDAIMNGLGIIDKYYEKVEIPESDSEDDSGEPNILYKPVDPYIDRPLPYVIGTAEWHKYWHVGLGHSSSDSEVENEQEQFSESESEQDIKDLPERDRSQIPGISDSESEDLPKNKMSRPVANSTFNDQTTKHMFDSSSDSETSSLAPQVNTVNNNFAEELAAKLGKVESSEIPVQVNTKPIKKSTNNIAGGLFSDEPPPLDDDDMFVNKNLNSGLFSSGNGLFDDIDDDNDFWNTKPVVKNKPTTAAVSKPESNKNDLFSEENEQEDLFSNKPHPTEGNISKPKENIKKPSGLFDEDDDDLFSTSTIIQPKKTILAPFKTTAPLVSEEPPELQPNTKSHQTKEINRNKPVSVIGPDALMDSKLFKKRVPSSSESDNDSEINKPKDKPKLETSEEEKIPQEPKKLPSLFDDTSPLFSDDIFNISSSKKFSSKLFDSESPVENDLFKSSPDENKEKIEEKKTNIPEETIKTRNEVSSPVEVNKDDDIFRNEPPPLTDSKADKTSLFDDNNDDFEDNLFSNSNKKIEPSKNPPAIAVNKQSKSLNLFADNHSDDDDDIFASITNKKSHSLFDPSPPALNETTVKKTKNVDLFDPNPPDLDEFDNKSESQSQMSLENEPGSYGSMNAGRASLFDTEPPMLSNESSGIVRDQSTRLESEDSGFFPYMTSSRRHSDMFQETQNADSLLTSKSKLSINTEPTLFGKSDLPKITEIESLTKIDITPSGNESSLVNNSSVFESTEKELTKPIISKKPSLFNEEENVFKDQKIDKSKNKNVSLFQESDSDDDLFSNKSSGSKNSSTSDILNNSSAKPQPKTLKNKNIFDDDLFSGPNLDGIPDVDLFKKETNQLKQNTESDITDKNDNKNNLFEDTDQLIDSKNKTNDNKKFNYEENLISDEDVKIDPKKSLSFEKNIEPEKSPSKEETDGQILSSGSSPGKLKHNLNINVSALLPGAAPPIKQHLEKSVSLDSSENNQNVPLNTEEIKSPEIRPSLEKSISFDSPVEHNEILTSAAKERVKIPGKRRPSSRRARQEAIRKSAADLQYEDAVFEDVPQDKIEKQNILNIANNNLKSATDKIEKNVTTEAEETKIKNPLLSPSTDEEDVLTMPREKDISDSFINDSLFGAAPVISPIDTSAIKEQIPKKTIETSDNLFDSLKMPAKQIDLFSEPTKTDLFASNTKKQPNLFASMAKSKSKTPDTSIFSSSDDENDLFSTPKSDLKKPSAPKPSNTSNMLLSSPDEDLFKPVSSSLPIAKQQSSKEDSLFDEEDIFSTKKIPQKSVIVKKSLFDDDDDNDDDIFGGTSSSVPKLRTVSTTPTSSSTSVKKPTTSRLKKLSVDTNDDIVDPLDALKK